MLRAIAPFAAPLLLGLLPACAPVQEQPAARQRQMFGLIEKFDRYDDNGDGYLTRAELAAGVKEAGTIHLTPAQLDRAMAAYDTNGDRRISHGEAQRGADQGPRIFGE